jgi:hypothetical protein
MYAVPLIPGFRLAACADPGRGPGPLLADLVRSARPLPGPLTSLDSCPGSHSPFEGSSGGLDWICGLSWR